LSAKFNVLVWLRLATKVPRGCPSPRWGAEENGKRQAETGGWDKGSLIEQQTKGTGTTMIQIRRKHNTYCTTHRAALHDRRQALPSRK